MEKVLQWLKSAWYGERKKGPEEVVEHFTLPDDKETNVITINPEHFLEYQHQDHCKLHENYSGATPPINNCNICWEIYSKKCKH